MMGTAAGVVMFNSAATALAAAAADTEEDYSAFEARWVMRARKPRKSAQTCYSDVHIYLQ